jgi:hypothetical protein
MAEAPRLPVMPEFAPIPRWREISGMARSKTYEELAAGHLRGVKCGRQLLIDVKHGLEYMRSLPPALIRPRTTPRRHSTPPLAPAPQATASTRQEAERAKARRDVRGSA